MLPWRILKIKGLRSVKMHFWHFRDIRVGEALNRCFPTVDTWCMIKILVGEGVVDGEGTSSERCLKWGGGGSLRDLSKNILKQGVGKGKSCS